MGGNALKHVGVTRKSKEEYLALAAVVLPLLRTFTARAKVIPAYRSKADFGDMDVLIALENEFDIGPSIRGLFQPRDLIHNGDVWSFDFKGMQIDLIAAKPREFDFALAYFSYNDLGNLMGRIAHNFGCKYGHAGLLLPVRAAGTHALGELLLTSHSGEAMAFLGYDPKRFSEGFETLEDIFVYAASTKYFNPGIYQYDNMNHRSRTRDRKRATYRAFVEWLETRPDLPRFEFKPKAEYLDWILGFWDKRAEYEALLAGHAGRQAVRLRFNGDLAGEWTGLAGKDLGCFMSAFRASIPNFDNWACNTDPGAVREAAIHYANTRLHELPTVGDRMKAV